MSLCELKEHIDSAIDCCQRIIVNHPTVILSEADFERLLSLCITHQIGENFLKEPSNEEFSVHTQISHYVDGKVHPDVRPDVLLLKECELKKAIDNYRSRKTEMYEGPSIAIELKYLHIGDSTSMVQHDFEKWESKLDDNTWLYVVVLLDISDNHRYRRRYETKEEKINQLYETMKNENPDDNNRIFCKVIKKTVKR